MKFSHGRAYLGIMTAVLGAVACVPDYCSKRTAAYLVNATHDDLTVDMRRVRQPLDCGAVEKDPVGELPLASFEEPQALLVGSMERTWLDRQIPVSARPLWDVCDAVWLHAAGMPDTVLFWRESNRAEARADDPMKHAPEPNAVYIERVGDTLVLTADAVQLWPME